MKQITASLGLALATRSKILAALETLGIGAVGGLLFLWAHLPGGLITGAMIATGIAAIAGRPLAVPPVITQAVLVCSAFPSARWCRATWCSMSAPIP